VAALIVLVMGLCVVARAAVDAPSTVETVADELADLGRRAAATDPSEQATAAPVETAGPAVDGGPAASPSGAGAPTAARAPSTGPAATVAPAPAPSGGDLVGAPTAGGFSVPAGVEAGNYTLRGVVRANGARVRTTLSGLRVGELTVFGERTFAIPVWITGADMPVGVVAVDGSEVVVDRLVLEPAAATFTTRGPDIIDPFGRVFIPRGVNEWVLGLHADGWGFSEADVAAMDRWGVTMVRLELGQQFALPQMCRYDPAYVGRVDETVRWITSRGMVAMIDLHWTTQGDPCGDVGLHPMADELSIAFWQLMAPRYKDNPLVVFDLFNEPHDISDAVWRDGGTLEAAGGLLGGSRTWRAVGMQTLYDTVRSTGATNLVFASGNNWASEGAAHARVPLDAFGLVVGLHLYCLTCGGNLLADIDERPRAVRDQLPVTVTEFGWNQDSGRYNANLIAWAEANRFGWLAYSWVAAPPDRFGLLANTTTFDPSAQGVPVRDALQRAAGS
jgi:hypothetical protein